MAAITKYSAANPSHLLEDAVALIPCSHLISEKVARLLESNKTKICPKCQEVFSIYVPARTEREEAKKALKERAHLAAVVNPGHQKTSVVSKSKSPWPTSHSAAPVESLAEIMKAEQGIKEAKAPKKTQTQNFSIKIHQEKRYEGTDSLPPETESPVFVPSNRETSRAILTEPVPSQERFVHTRGALDSWKSAPEIEAKIGYLFKNYLLLKIAFTHRSYLNEHHGVKEHNQRLEFLGDTALQLPVTDYLYHHFPSLQEGQLTQMRAQLVSKQACFRYIQRWDVGKYLLLGEGEKRNIKGRTSLLGDLFEAILGAIYLDGGQNEVHRVVFDYFSQEFQEILDESDENKKAQLQELCQQNGLGLPVYDVVEEEGPDHDKTFVVIVKIDDTPLGRGQGKTKKEAEQAAASDSLKSFYS